MDRRMKKALLAAAALLGLAACDWVTGPEHEACPPFISSAVFLAVQDSVTGANVAPGATAVLRSGAFIESVVIPPDAPYVSLGMGRAGTFTVTVSRTGYQTWTKTGVEVEEGTCGPETVQLTARLKPA
jgi:hypothetical protein